MITDTDQLHPQLPGQPVGSDDPYDGYVDYYGFDDVRTYILPDGKQFIEFKPMTEGARTRYEAATSRDVSFNRRTDDAKIRVDPGTDRHALIVSSVSGWNLVRKTDKGWQPVAFSKGSPGAALEQWLKAANPVIVNDLVDAIRAANPWLTDEMTPAMIDDEIGRLQELKSTVVEREAAGKTS